MRDRSGRRLWQGTQPQAAGADSPTAQRSVGQGVEPPAGTPKTKIKQLSKMYISKVHIKKFKSFEDVEISLHPTLNIFTGANNTGKTTILEAIALWYECFYKLLREAGKASGGKFKRHDKIFVNNYFAFDDFSSLRAPEFEDLFFMGDKKNKILISLTFKWQNDDIEIPIQIGGTSLKYLLALGDEKFDYAKFNSFFRWLPKPIDLHYASPVSAVRMKEPFVTVPHIESAILKRNSSSFMRNRLYRLKNDDNDALLHDIEGALSYILLANKDQIKLETTSDRENDLDVVFTYKTQKEWVDISLLGSGTLQVMEILLNMFPLKAEKNKDLRIVLLDEPDSHIHRDIQQRLLERLKRFETPPTQVFLTTHNEALIRSASLENLFHLEAKSQNKYRSVYHRELEGITGRYAGLYPTSLHPIISSLSDNNSLDFINALEADRIVFVEGKDDAQIIDILLKKQNNYAGQRKDRKYAYWVLGGIDRIFKNIQHYQTVFSAIKNKQSLWDKAVLIYDRDALMDSHYQDLPTKFKNVLKLETHLWSAYTLEATLLTDIPKLSNLLVKFFVQQGKTVNLSDILNVLTNTYNNFLTVSLPDEKKNKYSLKQYLYGEYWVCAAFLENQTYRYRDAYKDKINKLLDINFINENELRLRTLVEEYTHNCIKTKAFYKLMDKNDVEICINTALQPLGLSIAVDTDLITIFQQAEYPSVWFDEWNFLNKI